MLVDMEQMEDSRHLMSMVETQVLGVAVEDKPLTERLLMGKMAGSLKDCVQRWRLDALQVVPGIPMGLILRIRKS